jgi:hypothetical protein
MMIQDPFSGILVFRIIRLLFFFFGIYVQKDKGKKETHPRYPIRNPPSFMPCVSNYAKDGLGVNLDIACQMPISRSFPNIFFKDRILPNRRTSATLQFREGCLNLPIYLISTQGPPALQILHSWEESCWLCPWAAKVQATTKQMKVDSNV